jgi:pyruvate/2-oxoacid:ferredoxin oxidoreductase alpha subunit
VGGGVRVIATGSAHDSEGRLRKSAPEVVEVLAALQAKVDAHADELALVHGDAQAGAATLVVSYGGSARASLEACRRVRVRGGRFSFLRLRTLFPVPPAAIRDALGDCTRVVVVEENLTGLYAGVLEPHLDGRRLVRVNAVGAMVTPARVEAAIEAKG